MDPPTYMSFLVRLWQEPASKVPEQAAGWQGEVEHIQTGQRWRFDSLDQLLVSVRRLVEGLERI